MGQVVLNATSGTGVTPLDCAFPSSDKVYAHVFVLYSKDEALPEYADAIQNTVQGYMNDAARQLDCTSVRYCLNLPKAEVGTPLIRIEIHSGALLTDEQAAELEQ